jgi:hypothetical protein
MSLETDVARVVPAGRSLRLGRVGVDLRCQPAERSGASRSQRSGTHVHSIVFMKHVEALDRLKPLLVQLREVPGIKEKKQGTFYKKSKPLVHFHEGGEDLSADVRTAEEWDRIRVTTKPEQTDL